MNEVKLVEKLIEKNLKITMAESCTGGLLASKIVNVPNASKVFDMSFVTYSNESKMELLGVEKSAIEMNGVVSEVVAQEMAVGACKKANANVAVGISGIAGPTGGTKEKPIGTVCFGFKICDETYSCKKLFKGNREEVRNQSAEFAIDFLIEKLNEIYS